MEKPCSNMKKTKKNKTKLISLRKNEWSQNDLGEKLCYLSFLQCKVQIQKHLKVLCTTLKNCSPKFNIYVLIFSHLHKFILCFKSHKTIRLT